MDVGGVFARREEGRNGVDVRRERDDGIAEGDENVVAAGRGGHAFGVAAVARGEFTEMREEEIDSGRFPAGGRVQVDERARKGKDVHGVPLSWRAKKKEGTAKLQSKVPARLLPSIALHPARASR